MPLILSSDLYKVWLNDGLNQSQLNELIACGFTQRAFNAHPVSRDLYKKSIDTNKPYIIERVEKNTLF
jgi:hypothetical protein